MLNNLRTELKTVIFFIAYFIVAYTLETLIPSGAHAPGPGILLFLLSIPISIIYSLVLYFRYNRSENKQYLNSIFIISGFWAILFLILNFSK